MTQWQHGRWIWVTAVALGAAACAGGSLHRAASGGDMRAFRKALDERLADGDVDVDEAQDVATRLLSHQVEVAQGPAGRKTLLSVDACADKLDGPLARRASGDDESAAVAALMRLDHGLAEPLSRGAMVNREESYWRAAAARSLQRPASAGASARRAARWRRDLMVDHSAEVRRAALAAAQDAADVDDTAAVLEAARLDPDPQARRNAIMAAGAIASASSLSGLRDLWISATETDRQHIVAAWGLASRKRISASDAATRCTAVGAPDDSCIAWRRLWRLSQSDGGSTGVLAALELLDGVDPAAATAAHMAAAALLERTIDEAPSRTRVMAIQGAPLSWAHLLEAVVGAQQATDERVKVAALARISELSGDERSQSLDALIEVAKGDGLAAEQARDALASARDRRVIPLLSKDAKATAAVDRRRAASAYAQVGAIKELMALLADKDATVRGHAGCAILGMK